MQQGMSNDKLIYNNNNNLCVRFMLSKKKSNTLTQIKKNEETIENLSQADETLF